jgi:hypothetical protein
LPALVAQRGCKRVETLVTDRPEDGQYYLAPGIVKRLEGRLAGTDRNLSVLVVDGRVHPGQTVDLQTRIPSVTIRDRRELLWAHLGEENPVAETRFELRRASLARREAARTQRDGTTQSPTGTSGRLTARDQETQDLRATLEHRQNKARKRVQNSYNGVDGRVVLLGRIGAPTTDLWAGLTDTEVSATAAPGRPARPTTATAALGPHTLAVTDTPGVPGKDGLPESLTEAVPGLEAALEQATCVLGVGESREGLRSAVRKQFDTTWRSLGSPTPAAAGDTLQAVLETAEFAVCLPYDDGGHALVSELHDRATVHATEYDHSIYLRVEVPATATEHLRRRVAAVGGKTKPVDTDG